MLSRKNIEFVHKRSGSLDPPYTSPGLIGEEGILALILGKDVTNNQCEQKLGEYCKDLGNAGLKPESLHPELKGLCQEAKKKCTDLKTKITTNSDKAKNFLQSFLNVRNNSEIVLSNSQCNYIHVQCIVFHDFSDFLSLCDALYEQCHKDILQTLAYETLSRALSQNLRTQAACEAKIPDFCSKLIRENYYLLWSCFHQKHTCETLVAKKKDNCEFFKKDIGILFKNTHKLEKDCYLCLKNDCKDLKNRCKEKNVLYLSRSHFFNPLEFSPTLQERISLDQLFAEVEALAYHVKKLKSKYDNKMTLRNLCNKINYVEACEQINNDLQAKNKLYTLSGLSELVYDNTYAYLISKCYYLQSHCGNDFVDACRVLKAAYYRAQLYNLAEEVLEEELFGLLHNLNDLNGNKKCAEKLIKDVEKPKETCEALMEDVERRSLQLRSILDKKRDYPEEKDCIVLEKSARIYQKDFEDQNAPL
ncbi:hypothetical protein PMAC_003419 [Pneumocystis sp. 'macacae']|nr:hypothetical protein PMAC_003419 [Pneumocystis sp. 'macacae']